MFAVTVTIAVVCPGRRASSVDIDKQKSSRRYWSRTLAEIRRLVIRKPIYDFSVCSVQIVEVPTVAMYDSIRRPMKRYTMYSLLNIV
jgi:hypothetical protein